MLRLSIDADSVLRNRPFLYLWSAQAISQSAQNGVFYALMITIERATSSSLHLGLLILSTIIPSIVFGVAAGVFIDRWSKRAVLVATNALRAVVVLGFAFFGHSPAAIYGLNTIFSIITQFFAPAEVAIIPALVPRSQLIPANGFFNITFTSSQMVGFIILAPPLVKLLGPESFYMATAVVYVGAAGLVFRLPDIKEPSPYSMEGQSTLSGIRHELNDGFNLLRSDRAISLAMVELILAASLMLVMGMLAPGYVSRVLGMHPEDAVLIFIPVGIGAILGIAALQWLAKRHSKHLLAEVGLWGLGLGLFGLAVARNAWLFLLVYSTEGSTKEVIAATLPLLLGGVMGLGFIIGLAYSLLNVSAQTIVHELAPVEMRGRIFAAQLAVASALSILPLVFLGGLADLVGIPWVIGIVAVFVLAGGAFSFRQRRQIR